MLNNVYFLTVNRYGDNNAHLCQNYMDKIWDSRFNFQLFIYHLFFLGMSSGVRISERLDHVPVSGCNFRIRIFVSRIKYSWKPLVINMWQINTSRLLMSSGWWHFWRAIHSINFTDDKRSIINFRRYIIFLKYISFDITDCAKHFIYSISPFHKTMNKFHASWQ